MTSARTRSISLLALTGLIGGLLAVLPATAQAAPSQAA
ncbi:MAG: hypothetical protein JWN88_773, partial [Frankiales bacterium]|nr:hypothetical protein [Frankiales bacterium]